MRLSDVLRRLWQSHEPPPRESEPAPPEDHIVSTLDDACGRHLDGLLYVAPIEGWGWSQSAQELFADSQGVPPPFHVRVKQFYWYRGNRRGFVGVVEESGHRLNCYWFVCCTRYRGTFDFTDHVCGHNVCLCPQEPVLCERHEDDEWARLWPNWRLFGEPQLSGFADIAENAGIIARLWSR